MSVGKKSVRQYCWKGGSRMRWGMGVWAYCGLGMGSVMMMWTGVRISIYSTLRRVVVVIRHNVIGRFR